MTQNVVDTRFKASSRVLFMPITNEDRTSPRLSRAISTVYNAKIFSSVSRAESSQ